NYLRRISPRGVVSKVAGVAESWGTADGVGSDARLNHPFGVAVAPRGDFYIADTMKETIPQDTFAPLPKHMTEMSLNNGIARFALSGPPDLTCQIQTSSDLVHWANLSTMRIPSEGREFIADSGAANQPKRFYRALAPVISMAATSGTISSPFV